MLQLPQADLLQELAIINPSLSKLWLEWEATHNKPRHEHVYENKQEKK